MLRETVGLAALTQPLPLPDAFFWGCVGGLCASMVLFVLPQLLAAYRREADSEASPTIAVVILLLSTYTILAGIGTLFVGNIVDVAMALKVGVGVQGFIKGILATGREATRD